MAGCGMKGRAHVGGGLVETASWDLFKTAWRIFALTHAYSSGAGPGQPLPGVTRNGVRKEDSLRATVGKTRPKEYLQSGPVKGPVSRYFRDERH